MEQAGVILGEADLYHVHADQILILTGRSKG